MWLVHGSIRATSVKGKRKRVNISHYSNFPLNCWVAASPLWWSNPLVYARIISICSFLFSPLRRRASKEEKEDPAISSSSSLQLLNPFVMGGSTYVAFEVCRVREEAKFLRWAAFIFFARAENVRPLRKLNPLRLHFKFFPPSLYSSCARRQ